MKCFSVGIVGNVFEFCVENDGDDYVVNCDCFIKNDID